MKFHYNRPDLIQIVLQSIKMYDMEPNPKNRLISYRGLTLLNQIIKALSSSRISRKINVVSVQNSFRNILTNYIYNKWLYMYIFYYYFSL